MISYLVLQDAAVATGNGATIQLKGMDACYRWLDIQIEGITTATVTFEATINESDWFAVSMENLATLTCSTTATADGAFRINVGGLRQFRARISDWTAGTIYVYASAA